jgi:hypothetical protein
MKSNKHAGQFKLKGKKSILLNCRCCTVENWKQECRDKEVAKEIQQIRGKEITHIIIDELQE